MSVVNVVNLTGSNISSYLPKASMYVFATRIGLTLPTINDDINKILYDLSKTPGFSYTNQIEVFIENKLEHFILCFQIYGAFPNSRIWIKVNNLFFDINSWVIEGRNWAQCEQYEKDKLSFDEAFNL